MNINNNEGGEAKKQIHTCMHTWLQLLKRWSEETHTRLHCINQILYLWNQISSSQDGFGKMGQGLSPEQVGFQNLPTLSLGEGGRRSLTWPLFDTQTSRVCVQRREILLEATLLLFFPKLTQWYFWKTPPSLSGPMSVTHWASREPAPNRRDLPVCFTPPQNFFYCAPSPAAVGKERKERVRISEPNQEGKGENWPANSVQHSAQHSGSISTND